MFRLFWVIHRLHKTKNSRQWMTMAVIAGVLLFAASAYAQIIGDPLGLAAIGTTSSDNPNGQVASVANGGNATTNSLGIAVSTSGSASADAAVLVFSGTGNASGWSSVITASGTDCAHDGYIVVSLTGCATSWKDFAISGTGSAQGYYAISGTGPASGDPWNGAAWAISGTGPAGDSGTDNAISVAGPWATSDSLAISPLGNATGGFLAASATGNASSSGPSYWQVGPDGWGYAISGAGAAYGKNVGVSGANNASGSEVAISGRGAATGGSILRISGGTGEIAVGAVSFNNCDRKLVSISVTRCANGDYAAVSVLEGANSGGVSVSGAKDASGLVAATGTGTATGSDLAASGTGAAIGNGLSISGTGCANGFVAAISGTGCANGALLAISGLGSAYAPGWPVIPQWSYIDNYTPDKTRGFAVSGAGDANGRNLGLTGKGCATSSYSHNSYEYENGLAVTTGYNGCSASGRGAISPLSNANGEMLAVSGTGDASDSSVYGGTVAISGTGTASNGYLLTVSGGEQKVTVLGMTVP